MVEKTSWKGTITRRLRQAGMRGGYSRYNDRKKKSGIQIVKNRKTANWVFTPGGKLIAIEPKYHNLNSNDPTASATYKRDIKKRIDMLKKNPKYRRIIVEPR